MKIESESGQTAKVYAALVEAQRKAPEALGKQDRNTFAHFDYVSADRIVIAGRKAFNGAGLALIPISQEFGEALGQAVSVLRSVYRLVHGESGEFLDVLYECPVVTGKGKPEDKAGFGATTETLGYLYRGLLGIGRLDKREVVDVSGRDDSDYEAQTPTELLRLQIQNADDLGTLKEVGQRIAKSKLSQKDKAGLKRAYASRQKAIKADQPPPETDDPGDEPANNEAAE